MLERQLESLFERFPDVLYGYADISYSPFAENYQTALVFAVPYDPQITLDTYSEEMFETCISNAKKRELDILGNIIQICASHGVKYIIPPMAQKDELNLLAEFSYKFAAVNAGLGWIGKNDVLITPQYGPRVRLSVVLIDHPFPYGMKCTVSRCPADCTKCVDACPHHALKGGVWDYNVKRNELIDYHLCNQKRSQYIKTHGRKHACGICMAACPFGTKEM